MANTTDILSRLVTALTVSDSTWDVSVGTATYKILEAVAAQIAEANDNSTLLTYSYDVSSKFGTELNAFCNLFGISRQLGKRATGTVVFSCPSPATAVYNIPLGTQIYATSFTGGSYVYFTTTSPAAIAVGQTSVEVPVISTLSGSFNNVNIGTLSNITTTLVGITSVTNRNPITDGSDTETDTQLQTRFRATSFSNITGTSDKYTSVALQNQNVSQVNVIGSQERYREQLPILTVLSGNSNYILGFKAQSQLSVLSGYDTASLVQGSVPYNQQVISGFITQNPSGIFNNGSVIYDGTNYKLSTSATGSGTLTLNYVVSGTPTTLNGTSTAADVSTVVNNLLSLTGFSSSVQAVVSGNTTASRLYVSLTQPVGYNLIVNSGTISGINTITSQIPDSKYTYPQGGESVGLNLGTNIQLLLSSNIDYNYASTTAAPFKITLNPLASNAPYTYTGYSLETETEYLSTSSRISNPTINSNYVDIFINASSSETGVEQVVFLDSNKFVASGTGTFSVDKYVTASGGQPTIGDYIINLQQQPLTNFPAQVVSGNDVSYVTFGNYNFPVALKPVSNVALVCSGTPETSQIFTSTSISGLVVGMVISGTSGAGTVGIPANSYVTSLIPGSPNLINLNSNLTVSGLSSTSLTFTNVAYAVYDNTTTAGSINDISGIGFKATDPSNYGESYLKFNNNGLIGTTTYTYNSDVRQVDDLEQQARPVGVNLLVHQAKFVSLIVNLSIVYDANSNVSSVNSSILSAINNLFAGVTYAGVVRFSSILRAVLNVQGVINARIATSTDNSINYGIKSVNIDGSTLTQYTKDILLKSDQLPVLYGINTKQFGQNNF